MKPFNYIFFAKYLKYKPEYLSMFFTLAVFFFSFSFLSLSLFFFFFFFFSFFGWGGTLSSLTANSRALGAYGTRTHIYFNILKIFVKFLLLQDTVLELMRKASKIIALIELKL